MSGVMKQEFADYVFEGRNKNFGAYFLRRIYKKNIVIGFLTAGFFFSAAIAGPLIWKHYSAEDKQPDTMQMVEVVLEEPPSLAPEKDTPPPPVEVIEAPKVAEVKVLPPVVKPDEQVKVEEKIATQDDMKDKVIGNEDVDGESSLNELANVDDKSKMVVEQAQPVDDKIHTWVEETAEFPGGVEELKKYLMTNLKYPKEALDKQISGFVGIRFVINKDGSISDVVVEKSAGYGMDEEAIRVIKSMPRWKAARQNGASARLEKKIKIPFVLK